MEVIQKVLCAVTALCVLAGCALSQAPSGGGGGGGGGRTPVTRFTCQGRPAGYYADVDTGCQVYHMCDGMGRQFSYTCPNTTLFQQRMLVCDHWYMVNCSKAESDYDANLLIGQRDKPFVSEQEMHLRTPRPDILTVPYNHNYYDGLKQAETKYPAHPGNGIVTRPDSSATGGDGALDGGKPEFTPPTHTNQHQGTSNDIEDHHFLSSTRPPVHVRPSRPTPIDQHGNFGDRNDYNTQQSTVNLQYTSSTVRSTDAEGSDEFEIDIRMKSEERPTTSFDFIKRFDPNSAPNSAPNSGPNSHGTAMTTSQILDINRQLPASPDVSSEDTGGNSRRKPASSQNNFNTFQTDSDKNRPTPSTIFRTANTKPINDGNFGQRTSAGTSPDVSVPDRLLQPPKTSYPNLPSTTMGPPIYYEWKWAVPAFDLAPPKADNVTRNSTDSALQASESGRPTFRNYTRPSATPRSLDASTSSSSSSSTPRPEYSPSSYFVPDYIFPLDNPHPGYQENGAQTSFQVSVPEKGRSYGENPNCPQCHPAYLKPGTCEPCIVQR